MSDQNRQCPHCGHLFSDDAHFYFSVDFARYANPATDVMMQWCYNCNHVVVFRPVKFLGFIPLPYVAPKEIFDIAASSKQEICNMEDPELGGRAIYHLMLSIWYSFLTRAELDAPKASAEQIALRAMIERLPVRESAVCLVTLSGAHQLFPIDVQIERGMHFAEHGSPPEVLRRLLSKVSEIGTRKSREVEQVIQRLQ